MAANKQQILQIIDTFDKANQQFAQLPQEKRAEIFKASVIYKIKDKAKEAAFQYFSTHPLDSESKSRISLFVIAVKSANAAVLKTFEFQPVDSAAYSFLHAQLFKELELITKLQRLTPWTNNWNVYKEAVEFNTKLWQETNLTHFLLGPFGLDRRLYEYLALSYAFLSEINFMSVVTIRNIDSDPYVAVLHDLEEENGKVIQTQLRLLKDIDVPLKREEREEIVEGSRARIRAIYDQFLLRLCQAAPEQPAAGG